jgi:hypothetical protein
MKQLRDRETGRFRKHEAPVVQIAPLASDTFTERDILLTLIQEAGAHVGGMEGGERTYCGRWELFDPELVLDPTGLPWYWDMVYAKHNEPRMGDCVTLRYRYVHAPVPILGEYPRAECAGIFCFPYRDRELEAGNLVWIGNEFEG